MTGFPVILAKKDKTVIFTFLGKRKSLGVNVSREIVAIDGQFLSPKEWRGCFKDHDMAMPRDKVSNHKTDNQWKILYLKIRRN